MGNDTEGLYKLIFDLRRDLGDLSSEIAVLKNTVARLEETAEKLDELMVARAKPPEEKKLLNFFGSREAVLLVVGLAIIAASFAAVVLSLTGNGESLKILLQLLKSD